MSEISATEASKRFSDLLDAVEYRGETFTVVRYCRIIATIAPARIDAQMAARRDESVSRTNVDCDGPP